MFSSVVARIMGACFLLFSLGNLLGCSGGPPPASPPVSLGLPNSPPASESTSKAKPEVPEAEAQSGAQSTEVNPTQAASSELRELDIAERGLTPQVQIGSQILQAFSEIPQQIQSVPGLSALRIQRPERAAWVGVSESPDLGRLRLLPVSFLAVGCPDKSPLVLRSPKIQSAVLMEARHLEICGPVLLERARLELRADRIVLKSSSIWLRGNEETSLTMTAREIVWDDKVFINLISSSQERGSQRPVKMKILGVHLRHSPKAELVLKLQGANDLDFK